MNQRLRYFLFPLLILILLLGSVSAYGAAGGNVYVIPIKGEINPALTQFVMKSIEKAQADPESMAIIFEVDTLGGRVDQATQIRDAIMKTPLRTISLVNNKAESAGVLISIAAENIVMAKGATIGSAETIPYTEKNISYWRGELRTTAEQRGRDPKLVEAMADRRIEIVDPQNPDKYIVQKGELLNLTTKEAEKIGFTDYVSNNYEDILKHFNISYGNIIPVGQNFKMTVAQWVTSSVVLPVILSIGFIGLLIEILTPGFGLGGTISLIAFSIFFGGSILAGNAGFAVVLIFLTGILLLVIEAVIPGFGAPGIGGILCIIISIVLSSDSIVLGISSLAIAFVMTVIAAILLLKYAPKNKYFDKIILGTELRKDMGFSSIITNNGLLGLEGIVVTSLRPAGTIEVDGERIDVVSEGGFIEKNDRVRIVKIEGRRIVVKKIN
ncbi:membrane-bound serine protease (ClpP class) [Anaerosolibacter carboniphilus]|uniref:Membrane-bound serine protease (ClpP class) n=1 Tax=Anaerosolibacter carboniphilus TaxID=1417629 RepID=A0A841L024_9FIRM|nr:nodulation protein NfeD [Anaerosolibacter carboniphilus]MBB6217928.1 membrane-bound serine protease (ClpP class) [Anaerosolibacter carboniphilus]